MIRAFALTCLASIVIPAAELPVRRVVLYKNGVAWVERGGDVQPGTPLSLIFGPEEMNDVLKSMVVESRGGAVARVRYDGAVELKDNLSLEAGAPLAKILDGFRGSRVSITASGQTIEGRILSGRIATTPDKTERQELNLLLDGGEVRMLHLEGVTSIRLTEARLQKQLDDALLSWTRARAMENRSVFIDAPGATAVTARYLVPFPTWKSSYRLSLPEAGEATLEGWAIVDNASLEDWKAVQLTVVSGKPVSFVSRLYEPKYVEREEAELPDQGAAAPVVHERVMAKAPAPPPPVAMERAQGQGGGVGRGSGGGVGGGAFRVADAAANVAPMIAPAIEALGEQAGELFEYKFSEPVNVSKGESVLLPFVRQKLAARRLLIYSGGLHPRAAAELTNASGKTLDGGPITVYEPTGYAGEALMSTTKQGEKRLISFAEDLGVVVTRNFESGSQVVTSVSAKRGLITARAALRVTTTYSISNSDAKAKTLLVEHNVTPGQKLVSPTATETTPNHYRFSVNLAANTSEKLPVIEERELVNQISALSMTPDSVEFSLRNWKLSPAAQKQLQSLRDKKRAIAQTDKDLQLAQSESSELARDQQRIRENMTALSRVPNQQEPVQRYAQELAKMDAAISALQVKQNDLRRRKAALESELNDLAEKIEF